MATSPSIESKRRGFWLKVARERAGLSQETAAKEIGLSGTSKGTMSAWESGARDPKVRYLNALARLYGVPVSEFMDPLPTAVEQLEDRLAALARSAIRSAVSDVQAELRGQPSGEQPGGLPRTRSA